MSPAEAFLIFGLSPGAPWPDVQRRYKEEAVAWHPDRFAAGSALSERAQERLKQLNAARDCLRNHLRNSAGTAPEGGDSSPQPESVVAPPSPVSELSRFSPRACGLGAACGGLIALGSGWWLGVNLLVALTMGVVTGGVAGGLSSEADPRPSSGENVP